MVWGGGGLWEWMYDVRRALIVVIVECWWMRSGCRACSSCWAVSGGWWAVDVLVCICFVWTGVVIYTDVGGCGLFFGAAWS